MFQAMKILISKPYLVTNKSNLESIRLHQSHSFNERREKKFISRLKVAFSTEKGNDLLITTDFEFFFRFLLSHEPASDMDQL